jgi:uncharacterized protein with beta-barrel porin domain
MKSAVDRLFTFMNSAAGKFALLMIAICAPMHVAHAQMVLYSGSNQSGLVSTSLANPLTVRFSSDSYITLDWTVTGGNATIQESGTTSYSTYAVNTNVARGDTASVHLNLGNTPGPVTVQAHCGGCDSGIDVFFSETINGHNSIASSGGGGQTGQAGATLPTPLTVSFSGTSNATLLWKVTSGTATFQESGSTTYTALNGTTQTEGGQTSAVHLVLGTTPGQINVTATCSSGCDTSPAQSFTATIAPAPTNDMSISSGNNQTGTVNTTLASPLTVGFTGAPIGSGGVTLSWQVTTGGATIQESGSASYSQTITTGAGSTSSIHLSLGATAGNVSVNVQCLAGCTSPEQVTFSATANTAAPFLSLSTYSGDNQTGAPNTTLSTALEVLLTPAPSGFDGGTFPVLWHVESGSATIVESNGASYTDSITFPSGSSAPRTSHISVKFGGTVGEVSVSASCSQCTPSTRLFRLTNSTSTAAQLAKVSGDNQSGVAGSVSDAPLVVQLGTPGSSTLTGQPINWSVISGDATLSTATTQTDTNGLASISFAFGGTPGPVVIEASSIAGKVDFNATSYQATSSVSSGNNQIGAAGTTLAPFVVQISSTQPTAKGLASVPVQWKITSGSGTLASATTTSSANGQASNSLTLGSNAGTTTVTATIPGSGGSITTTFTARTVSSATIFPLSGDNQTGPAGTVLQPFVVQIAVAGQNAPGLTVDWSIVSGSGALTSATSISDASGHASNTLTLGATPGGTSVRASIGGLGSISFIATTTIVTGTNSQFTIVSGNNQALTPGQPSQPLIVKLVTAQGQPVTGSVVQWSVSGQTGTLGAVNTPTDSSGQAQNKLTVVLPGTYSVTAQLPGNTTIPALTFTFGNGVANLPTLTSTQAGVANVIDKACPALAALPASQLTPAQQDLLKRCTEIVLASGSNPGQVPGALGQLTNNKTLPQQQLANTVQVSQGGNLNSRLAELRQGGGGISLGGLAVVNDGQSLPLAALGSLFRKDPKQQPDEEVGKDFERWGFFATGMIERGGFSAINARPGFDFHNTSLTAGVDYRFNDAFVGGVAVGYNKNDSTIDQDAGKLNADSFSVNGYFTWYHANDFYIEGSLVLDWLSYDLSRNIAYQIAGATSGAPMTSVSQSLTASPDGRQTALSLSIGKDFNRGAWNISPYLRGVYSHLSLDSFSETPDDPNAPGAGLATAVDSRSSNSLTAIAGARVSFTTSFDWGVLVPNAVLEWNHELRNDPQTVITRFIADPTQTPMAITDQAPDQNYFNVGFGLNAVLPKGRSGFLLWEHLVGYAGAHENRYSLGIRIEF